MIQTRWRLLLVPILLGGMVGCGNAEAMKLNNAISKTTKDLEKTGLEFGTAMGQNKGNPAKLKELHSKVVAESLRIIEAGKAIKVPDVAQANEFHQVFIEYLGAEEKIIKEDFGQLITFLNQNNQGGVQKWLNDIQAKENTYVQKLKQAQETFAKANKFRIQQ